MTAAESAQMRGRAGRVAVLLVTIATSVVAIAWWVGLMPQRRAEARLSPPRPSVGALVPLEPFIANLADEQGTRYLRATLQVELYDARVPDEFQARIPQVRDLLLTLFTSKAFAEVRTPQGKAQLREEVVSRINRALQKDLVKAVYFTEFVVQ